jgi:hypothetical protein
MRRKNIKEVSFIKDGYTICKMLFKPTSGGFIKNSDQETIREYKEIIQADSISVLTI